MSPSFILSVEPTHPKQTEDLTLSSGQEGFIGRVFVLAKKKKDQRVLSIHLKEGFFFELVKVLFCLKKL